jgi:hypothetical protein
MNTPKGTPDMTAASTTTATSEYKAWHQKDLAMRLGGVAEWIAWYVENPSPLGGLFGRTLTRPEVIRQAVSNAATYFTGKMAEIHYSDVTDGTDPVARMVVSGEILGRGFVCDGSMNRDAIVIRNELGSICAIPIRNVADVENA